MNHFLQDTIVAPATIPGTGAISVIRISGPEALRIVDRVIRFRSSDASSSEGYRIKYGIVTYSSDEVLDEVLVSIFRAPHSYTGEDMAEISCHASSYIAGRLTELLLKAGARMAEPGEFTRRAFVNGKMDLSQAEAVADVIAAESQAAHRVAMNQLRGGFSRELAGLRGELLEMTSLLELELDFSEEDVEFADRSRLKDLLERVTGHVERLIGSFRLGNALRNGVPVAIVGPVNAGKSTLLNTLLQDDRAIVSDIAGTTRDTVEETLNIDGILFRFIDTAGIRETEETVEQAGIRRSLKKLSEAEIVLCMLDAGASEGTLADDLGQLLEKVDLERQNVFILLNKIDILGSNKNVININNIVSYIDNYRHININRVNKLTDALEGAEDVEKSISGCNEVFSNAETSVSGLEAAMKSESESGIAGPGSSGKPEAIVPDYPVKSRENNASGAEHEGIGSAGKPGKTIVYMEISAKEGQNIDELKKRLVESRKDLMTHVEGSLVTNVRHLEALRLARTSLSRVHDGLESGLPTDLVARDLRDTLDALGSILGETIGTEEILGNIFKNFCIGK